MSILNSVAKYAVMLLRGVSQPLLDLVAAKCCPVCGEELSEGQRYICTACRLDIPTTQYWLSKENPMALRAKAMRPAIEHASGFIFYIRDSSWRDIIHRLKYQNQWRHGLELGEWMGYELKESEIYADIEIVIDVPLHPMRHLWRGYNQSEYLARGIAHSMGAKYLRRTVRRKRLNKSQVSTYHDDRWRNVENLFEVLRPELLNGRKVLLVDDVFTTGATLLSCAEAILDVAPDCRLYLATLAVSAREFNAEF